MAATAHVSSAERQQVSYAKIVDSHRNASVSLKQLSATAGQQRGAPISTDGMYALQDLRDSHIATYDALEVGRFIHS